MTEQEQYLACAELDGFTEIDNTGMSRRLLGIRNGSIQPVPDYSTRDAVVAVIEKQETFAAVRFLNYLREIVGKDKPTNKAGAKLVSDYDLVIATPTQLREALLRATGKWKD